MLTILLGGVLVVYAMITFTIPPLSPVGYLLAFSFVVRAAAEGMWAYARKLAIQNDQKVKPIRREI